DAFTWQATLSNGRRADCLIHMPDPPGPLVVDAKFPLEPYEALIADPKDPRAVTAFRAAIRTHVRAIADKYILPGETADGACLFLPSEAIYAELHANHPDAIRDAFAARVWIVSPTTTMATLNTLRAILKDHRMREQAGEIRRALAHLHRDVELIVERAGKLETHFDQARRDVEGLTTAAERAGKRAQKLDSFEFGPDEPEHPKLTPIIRHG
ncbi:MAG: DNA recombination protein RmuC, partial [Pseudomonadota bacterium]